MSTDLQSSKPERDLFGLSPQDYDQYSHEFTGELVKARRPAVFSAITALLGCQVPICEIAKQLQVSEHTVRVVRDSEAAAVAEHTRAYASRLRRMSGIAFAHAMTKLPEASSRDAAVTGGILLDHAQILTGQPTEIVEQKGGGWSPARVDEFFSSPPIDVEVRQVPERASDCVSDARPSQLVDAEQAKTLALVSVTSPVAREPQPERDQVGLEVRAAGAADGGCGGQAGDRGGGSGPGVGALDVTGGSTGGFEAKGSSDPSVDAKNRATTPPALPTGSVEGISQKGAA